MRRKYSINEDYFETIDSEEKAYWLGFLFADGCVHSGRAIVCELGTVDLNHLEKFKKAVSSEHPITFPKGKNSCRLALFSKKMYNDLVRHGCHEAKSLTLEYPEHLKKEYDRHFFRGYFDGDGCISRSEFLRRRADRGNRMYPCLKWTVKVLGTKKFLETAIERLSLPVNTVYSDGTKAFQLKYAGMKKPCDVASILYTDSSIYLERKYNKFLEFKNELESKEKQKNTQKTSYKR